MLVCWYTPLADRQVSKSVSVPRHAIIFALSTRSSGTLPAPTAGTGGQEPRTCSVTPPQGCRRAAPPAAGRHPPTGCLHTPSGSQCLRTSLASDKAPLASPCTHSPALQYSLGLHLWPQTPQLLLSYCKSWQFWSAHHQLTTSVQLEKGSGQAAQGCCTKGWVVTPDPSAPVRFVVGWAAHEEVGETGSEGRAAAHRLLCHRTIRPLHCRSQGTPADGAETC